MLGFQPVFIYNFVTSLLWGKKAEQNPWRSNTLEWTAERLEVLVDGDTCLVNNVSGEAFHKRFIICFTRFTGTGANVYDGRVALPVTMEVDWVKAWR